MRGSPRGRRAGWMVSVVLLISPGGCAGAATPPATTTAGTAAAVVEGKVVRVQNNLIPPTSMTVYAVPRIGVRQMLGVLQASETRAFTFEPAAVGQYRLVGQVSAGSQMLSPDFNFAGTRGVTWDMNSNVVHPIT